MNKFKEVLNVTVKVSELYKVGKALASSELYIEHESDNDNEWFDLISESKGVVCMDGEECEIISFVDNEGVVFLNKNGEKDMQFTLYGQEVLIATGYNQMELVTNTIKCTIAG